MSIKLGIIGIGFVGNAMMENFISYGYKLHQDLFVYDKYKNGGIGQFEDILETDILFLSLPTKYNLKEQSYDISCITDTLNQLIHYKYNGIIVIKSTLEPGTTKLLSERYNLDLVHNPEFLTARTAIDDFKNQKHIVLGKCIIHNQYKFDKLVDFYKMHFPNAELSLCESMESESMKLFLNNFYAVKVQFFTELYLLCQKINIDYNTIKDLMLKNGWINQMHTQIPGPDGNISYSGLCFPKDTMALNFFMEKLNVPHDVLTSTINERNTMRNNDNINILL